MIFLTTLNKLITRFYNIFKEYFHNLEDANLKPTLLKQFVTFIHINHNKYSTKLLNPTKYT